MEVDVIREDQGMKKQDLTELPRYTWVVQWQESDLDYDSELERTLLRRRREARRRARQAALEQQLNMAAEHNDDNLNLENNQNRVTLGQYINPTSDSCGSTIRRPAIQANNFELKPSLLKN
ncbi:hypothetical protein PIB30_101989 [Stylosanthes scabra]|uniref:Uncharacterized protein n=1 Tax=Stylosanthes scabra TaxID=79078 RepID=A0ABU6VWE5_9FABA|nr:hypothetical protein [Stylosanthes scabra]